jgi:hypothetical protein
MVQEVFNDGFRFFLKELKSCQESGSLPRDLNRRVIELIKLCKYDGIDFYDKSCWDIKLKSKKMSFTQMVLCLKGYPYRHVSRTAWDGRGYYLYWDEDSDTLTFKDYKENICFENWSPCSDDLFDGNWYIIENTKDWENQGFKE